MLTGASDKLRTWVVGLFVGAISRISREEDRQDAIQWLASSRDIVGSDLDAKGKYVALYKNVNTSKALVGVFNSVTESARNYKNSNLPLAVKIALPVTLLAAPYAGGQAAGIAAFGSAIGVPVLLLIFLGTTGISSIIEACARNVDTRAYVSMILEAIAKDEALRQMRADIKSGKQGKPEKPMRMVMPEDEAEIRQMLFDMDWRGFEHHVMSFFDGPPHQGTTVTKPTGDGGIDGFAKFGKQLIVVQCKRNAELNLVGRPEVQQFMGAMQGHNAIRGYFVTTSGFTQQAQQYVGQFDNLVPIDMNELVSWHKVKPPFMY